MPTIIAMNFAMYIALDPVHTANSATAIYNLLVQEGMGKKQECALVGMFRVWRLEHRLSVKLFAMTQRSAHTSALLKTVAQNMIA